MEISRRMWALSHRNLARLFPSVIPPYRGNILSSSVQMLNTNPLFRQLETFNTAFLNAVLPNRRRVSLPVTPFVMSFLVLTINSWVNFDQARDFAKNNELHTLDARCRHKSYDYIVVGAGAAGMVVATRLANASRSLKVLLLEAGGEPSFLNDIPALDVYLTNQPGNTWSYKSTPQLNSSQGCDGKTTPIHYGKMLGGSSSTNFMLYVRGNKDDFNRWADDVNDKQWDYDHVLPYFKKSEDYQGAYEHEEESKKYHGKGGLLHVTTSDKNMMNIEDFLAAGIEKGYQIGDYNGENQEVFSILDLTIRQGWRESAYHAFYRNTGKPPNLCIKKYAQVTKINFESTASGTPRAVGVTYRRQELVWQVRANKEVILSSGFAGSPKILLQSGIGPKEHLNELGIPLVKDLPVGENLQDHVYTFAGPFLKGNVGINPNTDISVRQLARFLINGSGLIGTPVAYSGHAFLQSPLAQPSYPDIQIAPTSFYLYPEMPEHFHRMTGLKTEVLWKWLGKLEGQNLELVTILLIRPKSVGKLSLYTSDPEDDLQIDPKYLSHPDDSEALLWAIKKVVDLYENTTALNAPLYYRPLPECDKEEFRSDEYYKCFIRYISGSYYHLVGTCSLGKVVDSHLRVKGVHSLRVIDASIMPRTPSANTYASSVMIGEKGADLIIQDLILVKGGSSLRKHG